MFGNLIKEWKKLSPEEQNEFRELVGGVGEGTATIPKETKSENKTGEIDMKATEPEQKQKDTATGEKSGVAETADVNATTPDTEQNVNNQAAGETNQTAESNSEMQVGETSNEGNGIRVEDIALKAEVDAKISALEAKLLSVLDENKALKDKVDKYEGNDFGNQAGKVPANSAYKKDGKNLSFDEYMDLFEKK